MRYDERQPRLRRPRHTRKAAKRARRRRAISYILLAIFITAIPVLGANRLLAFYSEVRNNAAEVLLPHPWEPDFEDVYEPLPEVEEAPANRQFIYRNMGLFANRGDADFTGYMRAQYVYILEEYDNWLKIETYSGPQWINLNFEPSTYALDELLSRHGDDISVYFKNMESGFVYQYNAGRVYFSASVPKAFYALYLLQLAEKGIIDLDSTHRFTEADANWGSGIIQRRYDFGTYFSLRELIRLNISESDNVATLMLRRIHGLEGYKNLIASIGGNPDFVGCRVMNSNLTANEAGLFAKEIFRYIQSGSRYSQDLKAHLLDNQFPFISADYPIASKTGWTAPRAWHDMAIVYAPSPFILVVLSAREGWSDADYEDFAEIGMAFQQFNDMWFVH